MNPQTYQEIAKQVYNVDSTKPKKDVIYEGDVLSIKGMQWKVIKAKDNQKNGFQGMAVAPITNDVADTSQIVVAYAGTNPSDMKDIGADALNVVFSRKEGGQLNSANEFANEVKREYPNALISTTGHSLGAFLSLAQGAEHHWPTVTFNGPDPYEVLSNQARDWVEENPEMLTNFLNKMDLVGYGGDIIARFKNGLLLSDFILSSNEKKILTTHAEVVLNYGDFKIKDISDGNQYVEAMNYYHNIDLWKFDENGNLLDGKGKIYGLSAPVTFKIKMNTLNNLRKRLTSSSGGLSSGEKVYLDSAQALTIVSTAAADFDASMQNLLTIYREGIQQQEKLWEDTFFAARRSGDMLDDLDIYKKNLSMKKLRINRKSLKTDY